MEMETMLNRAMTHHRISRREWEVVLENAVETTGVVLEGQTQDLHRLVAMLEAGLVEVEGVPYREVLRCLAVFL